MASADYGFMEPLTDEERNQKRVMAKSFSLDQEWVDSQFEGIIAASDGRTYFGGSSHCPTQNGQFYSFDPEKNSVHHIADLGEWVGEEEMIGELNTQGKIHSQIYEANKKIYMTTTVGDFPGEFSYHGGHFIAYDLEKEETQHLAHYPDLNGGGLLTMHYEPVNNRLYAIHQRNRTLIYYDLDDEEIVTIGSIENNQHQCRCMISDHWGNIYGCSSYGMIWRYNPANDRRSALHTLIPHDPEAEQPAPQQVPDMDPPRDIQREAWTHWSLVRWDPQTEWWYGVRRNDEYLFRMRLPEEPEGYRADVEGLTNFGCMPSSEGQPRIASLALVRKGRKLYYISPERDRDEYVDDSAAGLVNNHLMSYDIDSEVKIDHGPIFTKDGRRVAELSSMTVGSDGKLHGVAPVWSIEGEDPTNDWSMAVRNDNYTHLRFLTIDLEEDLKDQ